MGYTLISILGSLPRYPGRFRLLHQLSRMFADCHDVDLKVNGNFTMRLPGVKDGVGFCLLIDKEYEPETLVIMRKHLREGDVFIDVGANIGSFVLPGAAMVGNGKVIAIEASTSIFKYLSHNVTANSLTNVELINCAATSENGEVTFFDAPTEKFGMGSRAPWSEGDKGGYKVTCRTLVDILKQLSVSWEQVKFIKIDVEGFELDVLKGGEEFLKQARPCIFFEFIDWAEKRSKDGPGSTQAYLMALGYDLYTQDEYLKNGARLKEPIRVGSEMIVAVKR